MELRQLEYFRMASRLNNITRAAERLHVSQPNITTAIRKLEQEIGIELFDRSQKQISLTPAGKVFLPRVETALQILQDALIEMSDFKELQKGAIRLGIPPMIGSYLFPQIFFNFQRMFPKLDLSIVEEGSLSIREKLEAGELDLGIVIITNAPAKLNIFRLTTNQILVCLPLNHPLTKQRSIAFGDLKDQPFIMLKEDSYHRQLILHECAKHSFTPKIVLSSSQIDTIKGLVANGIGISFLFDVISATDKTLTALPFTEPLFVDIGLAWHKDKYLSHASRTFIDFIANYAGKSLA